MATAETTPSAAETTPTAAAVSPLDRVREALGRLDNKQKVLLMVSIAASIALLVAAGTLFRQNEFKILFSNISERDGGAIIAALEQMNVSYKFNDSGNAILVPVSRVHDVRLRLASQGLPRGGAVGFELMESQKFGISQFAEYRSTISAVWKASCREPSSRSRRPDSLAFSCQLLAFSLWANLIAKRWLLIAKLQLRDSAGISTSFAAC